jgi:high-affinity iron transporter
LIGLREGLQASMVVVVLVAFLVKSDRRDAFKWVWLGVGVAIAMTLAVFLVVQFSAYTVTGLAAEAIAGIASMVAVTIVTTMVLWMRKAAARLSGELREDWLRGAETAWPLIGLAVGVLAAAIAYGMYAGAVRINLGESFKHTGEFLIVVAAGILRCRRSADGWLAARTAKQGLRYHLVNAHRVVGPNRAR